MTTAIAVIVDVSVVTALALLVCRALRHKPAAVRHMILAVSLGAAAVAPALEAAIPQWELPLLAAASIPSSSLTLESELSPTTAAVAVAPVRTPRLTLAAAVAAVWGIGAFVVLAGLLAGVVRLTSMTRRCRPIPSGTWRERAAVLAIQDGLPRPVAVLECPDRALLLTWGVFRPRIIVPADAASWTGDRIDVVLAHELAHIARRDWALQILAEIVRAVYWFNPLVWITCRRLRDESEHACDDAVLRRGLSPVDYASHLLAVARHLLADGRTWASAPAVADPSTLERRIAAMLKDSRNRQPLTRTAAAFTVAGMFAVAVPLAAVTLTARQDSPAVVSSARLDNALALSEHQRVEGLVAPEPATMPPVKPVAAPSRALPRAVAAAAPQAPASISGAVRDISGALLPGVQLTLTNSASGTSSATTSDRTGSFAFRELAPSAYRLEAKTAWLCVARERGDARQRRERPALADAARWWSRGDRRGQLRDRGGGRESNPPGTSSRSSRAWVRSAVRHAATVDRHTGVPRYHPDVRGTGSALAHRRSDHGASTNQGSEASLSRCADWIRWCRPDRSDARP
jgi:beta-lactamase regulating signal transducer with metallopeptidase domain